MKRRLLLATLILTVSGAGYSRVFLRRGALANSTRTMESLGGRIAYEAPVKINGGSGQLSIFSYDEPLTTVSKKLARAFASADIAAESGTMSLATVARGNRVLRLLLLQMDSPGRTLVFAVNQSKLEFAASADPPSHHPIRQVRSFPGSKPVFFAANEETGMSLSISLVDADPRGVGIALESGLLSDGWQPALQPSEQDSTAPAPPPIALDDSPMRVYLMRDQLCCTLIEPAEHAGTSRIILLHKRQLEK